VYSAGIEKARTEVQFIGVNRMESNLSRKQDDSEQPQEAGDAAAVRGAAPLAEFECRLLIAEQARQLAHRLRSPLGAIDLVCESLVLEQPDGELAERLQVALRASAKMKQALEETVSSVAPRWSIDTPLELSAVYDQVAQASGVASERPDPAPIWINAPAEECELALWQALVLARQGSRAGQVHMSLVATSRGAELSFVPVAPLAAGDCCAEDDAACEGLSRLRQQWLRRFATERGGALELDPRRLLLRLQILRHEQRQAGHAQAPHNQTSNPF
jgi:hypothetical protein